MIAVVFEAGAKALSEFQDRTEPGVDIFPPHLDSVQVGNEGIVTAGFDAQCGEGGHLRRIQAEGQADVEGGAAGAIDRLHVPTGDWFWCKA